MSTLAPPMVRALTRSESGIGVSRAGGVPEIRPGEALVRIDAIGLGSGDVAIAAGRVAFRGVMGREFVGRVERVAPRPGRESDAEWVGRRVTGQPFIPCAACDLCRGGLASVCPARIYPGLRGRDGCGADLAAFPISCLHAVPAGVGDDAAILAASLATAVRALHMSGADARSYLTILGDGAVGLLCAQIAITRFPHTRLLGSHAAKFALCERWGVKHRHVRDAGARRDQHAVIDCTNSRDGLRVAAGLVLPRGRIVKITNGLGMESGEEAGEARAESLADALAHEVVITGVAPPPPSEGLAMLAKGQSDIAGLVTRRMTLEEGPAAVRAAGEPNCVKMIITM